ARRLQLGRPALRRRRRRVRTRWWRWWRRVRVLPRRRIRRSALSLERHPTERHDMDTSRSHPQAVGIRIAVIVTTAVLVVSGGACRSSSAKAGASTTEQRFASPKEAVDALLS